MKSILITDIHFGCRGSSPYFIERYKLFFKNIFFPYIDKHNIKHVQILGDTWEDRKTINVFSLKSAREMFFDELLKRDIEVIAILGNHDVFYRNTNDTNSMNIIETSYSNIHVVDEYEEFKVGNKIFGLMNWVNNENLERNLNRIKTTSKADYLCGHFEINGFELTKGNIADKGFSQDIFSRFKAVLSGHFHIRNTIGNITFIGNPFQTNWDDYSSDRGFTVYDSEEDEFTFIKNTYENYEVVIYTDDTSVDDFDYENIDGKIVKILVTSISDLNQVRYNKFIKNIEKYVHSYLMVEAGKDEIETLDVVTSKTTTDMIKEYVHALNVEDSQRSAVLDIMNNLHSVAISVMEDE